MKDPPNTRTTCGHLYANSTINGACARGGSFRGGVAKKLTNGPDDHEEELTL